MDIGKRIKDLREQRGLTQRELSEATGRSQATLSRIENGEFKNIRGETLTQLADSLRISTDYLLGRSDSTATQHPVGDDLGARALLKIYQGLQEADKRTLGEFAEFLAVRTRNKG